MAQWTSIVSCKTFCTELYGCSVRGGSYSFLHSWPWVNPSIHLCVQRHPFITFPEIDIWWNLTSDISKLQINLTPTATSYICAHISRSQRPLLLPPRLRADAAVTGCASECPAPASAALSSSAASGSPPGAAGPAAGSAGPSCGPCPCSSSRRCCSSLVAGDTLHCPCWCSSCSPEHAELAGGRKRSPTDRKLV